MNLLTLVSGLAGFLKTKELDTARIDNVPFRLHHSFTAGFLFLAQTLLGVGDVFGKGIQCYSNTNSDASNAINQYCWVSGTYTVPGSVGPDSNIPNIGAADNVTCLSKGDNTLVFSVEEGIVETKYLTEKNRRGLPKCKMTQSYYQWVPFILMFQGLLFLAPNWIWRKMEQGKMASISEGIRLGTSIDAEKRETIVENIAQFISKQETTAGHARYAFGFLFCLYLCIANVCFNFWFLDLVLAGNFLNLGTRWVETNFDFNNRLLLNIFPRMTACEWNIYGSAGGIKRTMYLCILPQNMVTEKIFLFLWFWYIILGVISSLCAMYYTVLLLSSSSAIRQHFLQYAVKSRKLKNKTDEKIEEYLRMLPGSNFFFLYCLAHNVELGILREIIFNLYIQSEKLETLPPTYRAATSYIQTDYKRSASAPAQNLMEEIESEPMDLDITGSSFSRVEQPRFKFIVERAMAMNRNSN